MKAFRVFLFCIAAVALNFLCAFFFYDTLRIPLFFDTIFTVATVFYLGILPALFVSLSYNITNSIIWFVQEGKFDPLFLAYSLCGIAIVVITWLIARRKEEFRISTGVTILYLFLIAILSSLGTVLIGGTIDYFHLKYFDVPDMMNPIKSFTEAFYHQQFSLFASCVLAQIPISIFDRLLATFSGYGVYRLCVRVWGERF